MTALYYDCEFVEDGRTIDLVSIGIVAETGAEYYAVSSEFDRKAFAKNAWLMANVWPSLPQVRGDARMMLLASMREGASAHRHVKRLFNYAADEVAPRAQIAHDVSRFILGHPNPQLWAWYGAYDHVVLAQLFGRMIDLPDGMPMWTNDLKQEAVRLGLDDNDLPQQEHGQHNALEDARHNRVIGQYLRNAASAMGAR